MPSDKPRITLRLDQEDIDCLQDWAKQEFLTVPQLARIIVKRAVKEWAENQPVSSTPAPDPKGKRGK